mgnify:CR=1 FL=1
MIDHINFPLISVLIFHAIVFLQSGLDKLFNWKANLDFTNQTLGKTFSKQMVKFGLLTVLFLETLGGIFSILGIVFNLMYENCLLYAQIGLISCVAALLLLLFGQRISQNYEGAKTIAIYFIVSVIGLMMIFN